MRIIGEIEGHPCKITVFEMEEKISIKFEVDLMEQTYKLRKSEILNDFNDIAKLVDGKFVEEVMVNFLTMNQTFDRSIRRMATNANVPSSEFDEII